MARESTQHKLDRVRSPRVHITYDVEIGDAIEMKEIPFVVGVLGDYSGKPEEPLPKLMDRKFTEIDRDNFNNVLAGMKPRLAFQVDNKITDDNTKMNVELKFRSLDDFHPEQVANQIEPLRRLVEARSKLTDLVTKLDGNDKLEELLQKALGDSTAIEALGKAAGVPTTDKTE
jgi:type VI secretion system protein ImpB